MTLQEEITRRRTFAVIAHPDAGKTTLTEKLLLFGGAILFEETEELYNQTKPNREMCELRNMIAVAYLVIKQGREIKESVGCHYNMDYPKA